MEYGYFDDSKREYVITNPKTPVKWINYIGTLAFGGFVDHTGGALVCQGDPALNRITKYIAQMPSSEFKGETLYLRFKQGSKYKTFSPYFVPTLDPYDLYECHVGLGYMRIVSEFYGFRTDVTIFVPPGASCVIRDIIVTNVTDQAMEVDAVPVVEYTHPDSLKQLTNADWVPQTMQSKAIQDGDYTVLIQYPFMFRDNRVNYFTSNWPVSSFESNRKTFLGDNEYGTWANPLSLQRAELSNTEAQRGDNIAALMHHLGVIQPGETKRLITQLGQASAEQARRLAFYRDEKNVEQALKELARFWDGYLAKLQVEAPDAALNRMLNIHNPRQCHTTKNWSRYLSLYQLGYGARGIGFRDSSQDVMGVLATLPQESKALIRQLLSVQRRNGCAMHQFNPLTMIASEGDSLEYEDRPHYYSDDHLWIILAVCAYIKETGDFAFLDEVIPYYDESVHRRGAESAEGHKDKTLRLGGEKDKSGTVLDHLKRAIEFTRGDVGAHGLPLLGFADWNDTMNLRKGAESLFVAGLYGKALLEMIELARHLGDSAAADKYAAYYDEMKQRVNEHAWDGEWYKGYFDADGAPLGSRANSHGQIYVTGQPWPVISGFATPERAGQALDSVNRLLNTRNGIKLSVPAFNGFDPKRGGITTYPPGTKENGGIFLHTNPWVIIAETFIGNGDRAYEYYAQINPAAKNGHIDEFECEPYVYPQNILSDEHPQFGAARNSWLSGTASWMYQAGTQYILGILPVFGGLQINPCIPAKWPGFRVTREFRGAVYQIEVENPNHVCKGVKSVQIDGKEIEGNIVPTFEDGKIHQVKVVLGN